MPKPALHVSLLAVALVMLVALAFRPPGATPQDGAAPRDQEFTGQVTTLYVNDPFECSLDLRTGRPGLIQQEGEVRNRDSHVSLGYYPDSLTVAIQGGDVGAIVDLDDLRQVADLTGVRRTGNGGNAYVELPAALADGLEGLQQTSSSAHAAIQLGHVYVVRIVDSGKPDLLAKLLVLEFRPGESVTFRWQQFGA